MPYPTSEVGLEIQSESEGGAKSSENNSNDNKWREIIEQQSKNFIELLKTIKSDKATSDENKSVALPKFNPDEPESNAVSWCSTINLIMETKPLKGSELIVALSNCLLGSASYWLPTICFADMKWSDFQQLFLQRFGGIETPAAVIYNILNDQPKENENLSVYGSRQLTSLMGCWKNLSKEEIAVSFTLAHCSMIDKRLHRSLHTSKIMTRDELQQELKVFVGAKRRSDDDPRLEGKKMKLSNLKCHFCGKLGHKMIECRLRLRNCASTERTTMKTGSSTITCYRCGQPGHIASKCASKQKNDNNGKSGSIKNVNICMYEQKCTLRQAGESYQFYFDSGAECSLIKESIGIKFSGKRENNVVILKGIGNATLNSSVQIRSVVKINSYSIEILFHVVPDESIKQNIIIGHEILSIGFGITLTVDDFKIFKVKAIDVCLKSGENFDCNNINTEMTGDDRLKLFELINNYKNSFINGFPISRITTGQLEIRLSDPNKTVQRRPYRLSQEEREIVRNKIKELMEANIIRPSCSPFASPILFVKKKKDGTDRMVVDYRELNANTIADQGRCFTGKEFVDFCSSHNIKLHLIATGASRANGQVERTMSTLKSMLTAVETSKRSWQEALGEIQLALNSTVNRVTKASPLELFIGKVANPLGLSIIDESESIVDMHQLRNNAERNIKSNASYEKTKFDNGKAKIIRFNVGDYVLLRAEERHQTKLDPKYKGPFQVVEALDNDRYILRSLNSKRTYKYSHESLRKFPSEEVPEELDFENGEESSDELEDIVGVNGIVDSDTHQQVVERDGDE